MNSACFGPHVEPERGFVSRSSELQMISIENQVMGRMDLVDNRLSLKAYTKLLLLERSSFLVCFTIPFGYRAHQPSKTSIQEGWTGKRITFETPSGRIGTSTFGQASLTSNDLKRSPGDGFIKRDYNNPWMRQSGKCIGKRCNEVNIDHAQC
jgi:hypothetical protein